jgi:hypothetical protein
MQQLINKQIAILVALSALLLGMDQFRLVLPLVVAVVAALSLRYTDQQQRFHVSRAVVNLAIFLIAIVTGWRLVQSHGWLQAVVIGQTLIALQCILLVEAKTARTRWDLISLSLLTVFLSTSFNQGPLYALVLITYFFFAFCTLALLFFEREQLTYASGGDQSRGGAGATGSRGRIKTNWWRLAAIALATLVVGPLALFLRFPESAGRRRRRHAAEVTGGRERPTTWSAQVRTAADLPTRSAVGREFRWRMGRITAASAVVSLIVFLMTPRFGRLELHLPPISEASWTRASAAGRREVGFSDRVALGELGTVSENQQRVLEVQFSEYRTGKVLVPRGELYLRGGILTAYQDGHWAMVEYGPPLPLQIAASDPVMRQRIAIEQREATDLFCVWPFVLLADNQPVRYDSRWERLRCPRDMRHRSFSYELATTAFDDLRQTELVPCRRPIDRRQLLQWPSRQLPALSQLAGGWMAAADIPRSDVIGRARYLTERLQSSRRFQYSLADPEREPGVDPIEDFVGKHPQGNCEFFASALALMLRSQGISSRLVVGYRTGAYQRATESFPVRQCDAHAWVEAYIPPEHLAGHDLPANHSDWSHGAWLRLEPTPAVSNEISRMALFRQSLRNMAGWVHSVWRENVLGMSGSQQRSAIYRPLLAAARRLAADVTDPARWGNIDPQRLWTANATLLGRLWLACLAMALGVVLIRVRMRPLRWSNGRRRAAGAESTAGMDRVGLAVYERLEELLTRYGHTRPHGQTQREFVRCAGERIALASGERSVADWALEVVQAYYQVRFGRGRLDRRQTQILEDRLARIRQAAVRAHRKTTGQT